MNKLKVLVLASLVALVAFTGCQNPINPGQGGILTVSMNDAVSRSILPGISMNPASYDLAGTGPNGASFNQSVSSGSSGTITDLAFGEWTVTATAKNAAGTAIGQGSGSVTVLSNASVNLAITVRPYDGLGTLALDVSWPAAQVQTAQIQSILTPATGTARNLAFNMNGSAGTASFSASDVATGYHTLILKLLDNGHLAIGAVEVVRIVKDQTTSGTMAFANVNQATGTLEVNLTPEMADPLEVSISGSSATKPANQSLGLSAAVNNYSDNVTYVWYVNGDAVATGASYNFGNSYALGYYRIDVTAFSADGKRAGSSTTSIQVIGNVDDIHDIIFPPAIGTIGGQKATDSKGNIYLYSYTYNGGLLKISSNGQKTELKPSFPSTPHGLLGSPYVLDDNTLLIDTGRSGLMKYDIELNQLTEFIPLKDYYYGISNILLDSKGRFLVGRTSTVILPDNSTQILDCLTGYSILTDNALYTTSGSYIKEFNFSGKLVASYYVGRSCSLYGITIGPDGCIYAGVGSGNPSDKPATLFRFDPVTKTIEDFITLPNWIISLVSDGTFLYAAGSSCDGTAGAKAVMKINIMSRQYTVIE